MYIKNIRNLRNNTIHRSLVDEVDFVFNIYFVLKQFI